MKQTPPPDPPPPPVPFPHGAFPPVALVKAPRVAPRPSAGFLERLGILVRQVWRHWFAPVSPSIPVWAGPAPGRLVPTYAPALLPAPVRREAVEDEPSPYRVPAPHRDLPDRPSPSHRPTPDAALTVLHTRTCRGSGHSLDCHVCHRLHEERACEAGCAFCLLQMGTEATEAEANGRTGKVASLVWETLPRLMAQRDVSDLEVDLLVDRYDAIVTRVHAKIVQRNLALQHELAVAHGQACEKARQERAAHAVEKKKGTA